MNFYKSRLTLIGMAFFAFASNFTHHKNKGTD